MTARTGRPGRRRRVATWLVLALVLAVLYADQRTQHGEYDALVSRAASAQASLEYADGRVSAMVLYTSPLLGSSTAEPSVRAGLRELVQQAAREQLPAVVAERDAAAAIRVLPWHRAQRRARAAYLTYLDARTATLRGVATDFRTLYVRDRTTPGLLADARAAFASAAPGGEAARADALLSDR